MNAIDPIEWNHPAWPIESYDRAATERRDHPEKDRRRTARRSAMGDRRAEARRVLRSLLRW
jgi:hypothetical protein